MRTYNSFVARDILRILGSLKYAWYYRYKEADRVEITPVNSPTECKNHIASLKRLEIPCVIQCELYTYVFLSSLGKASTISEKGLLTPYTVVGGTLVPSRSNGGPVEWLMSKHWKKSFHPSLVPLSFHTVPLSFFPPLSFLYCFPSHASRLPKDTRPLKNSKEQKWRGTDRQIYRGISFAGCAWQILDSLNRLSSFSLFPSFPANVSTTFIPVGDG